MLPGREPFAVCVEVPTGRTFDATAIEVGGRQDQRRPWLLQDHVRPSQHRLRGEHEARKCQDGEVSVHAIIPVTGNGTVIRSMDHLPVYAPIISMGYATAFAQLCPTLCPVQAHYSDLSHCLMTASISYVSKRANPLPHRRAPG